MAPELCEARLVVSWNLGWTSEVPDDGYGVRSTEDDDMCERLGSSFFGNPDRDLGASGNSLDFPRSNGCVEGQLYVIFPWTPSDQYFLPSEQEIRLDIRLVRKIAGSRHFL